MLTSASATVRISTPNMLWARYLVRAIRPTEQTRVFIQFWFLLSHKDAKDRHPSDQVRAGDT